METDFLVSQMQLYNTSIEDIGFSDSVLRCLRWHEYKTIGKLARMNPQKIRKIPGLNEDECAEIIDKLGAIGIMINDQTVEQDKRIYDRPNRYPYPNNLIAAIRDIDPRHLEAEFYSRDQMIGIFAALSSLPEQEETMIVLRYKHGATFEQIGNFYGVTRERARQVIHLAVRKLRHPMRSKLIDNGLNGHIEAEAEKRAEAKVSSLLRAEYIRGYNDGLSAAGDTSQKKKLERERVLQKPITDFDISVRTFNVLKRAGVGKLGDLLKYETIEQICGIRNMGRKSAVEIAIILSQNGICNDAWTTFLTSSNNE